jgi:hypothetical protein
MLVYLYEDGMTYIALYMVLALPFLSLFITMASRRRFLVGESLSRDDIVKGEQTQYILHVHNSGYMPASSVRVRFKACKPGIEAELEDQYVSIGARKSREIVFDITAKYRGHYEIGILDIVIYDFLGLFRFKQKHERTLQLMVRPQVYDIEPLPLVVSQAGAEDVRDFSFEEDYAIISDLRKYHPTDGYKKIHWKISAKKNELISKNFQGTKRNTAAFIIDNSQISGGGFFAANNEEAATLEDIMMQTFVSALAQTARRNNLCGLYHLGEEPPAYSDNFAHLYEMACRIRFDEFKHEDFKVYIESFSKMQTDTENIVFFVREIGRAIFSTAQVLKLFGNNVIIFYFKEAKWEQAEHVELLREMGVFCVDFSLEYADSP